MPAAPHPDLPEFSPAQGAPPGSRLLSCMSIFLATVLGLIVLGVLFFLSLGFAAVVVAVFAGIFGLIALQYLLWGWWLPAVLDEEPPDEPAP